MSNEADHSLLTLLRRMDARTERMAEDIHHLEVRVTALEEAVVENSRRFERLEHRVGRIERALDPIDLQ
ncbi:hypothetical protein [Roseixanthobacter glucoisosaccharinicivorans]|uniref:hypothetical protein n=1 Tax=Roseixanthobacter glucoisosaccharinicivorans TaxID=3119923 RepID=UPI0037267EB6